MSIELMVAVFGLVGTLATAFGAWRSDPAYLKRTLIIISVFLALASIAATLELATRSRNEGQLAARLERQWTLLLSSEVHQVEVELLIDGGFTQLDRAQEFLGKVEFTIDDLLIVGPPNSGAGASATPMFSKENISKSGLLGVPVAEIKKTAHDQKATIVQSNCVASVFATKTVLQSSTADEPAHKHELICALRVSTKMPRDNFTLADIFNAKQIALFLPNYPLPCAGPCGDVIISVRAILPSMDGLFPSLVEISPQVYSSNPTEVGANGGTFRLPGSTTLDLAKSFFRQSYGFADKDSFPLTIGIIHGLYVYFTKRTETDLRVVDVIWSTTYDEDALEGAIDPTFRKVATIYGTPDWCGFGDRSVCWHRFIAMSPARD